jgi:hypothetical protein
MNVEVFFEPVESTQECLHLIDPFKQKKFKRKSKFKIKVDYIETTVRVFTDKDSGQTFSILTDDDQTKVLEIDLTNFKDTIKEIQENAKLVYTHDYGEVWFNPFSKKVWVSGGDGGIIRFEESPIKLAKLVDRGDIDFDNDLGFENISGIQEEIIEAESGPYNDDGFDEEYILVAKCRDITDYIEY